ncbi:MAG: bifunctional 5,10-methylenetetrahydrofolate dehydrogenase/5,10-methenyltetrahydrofolate cyclohydrolase [Candidatus Omnitrophica bacterium]|nr:bifunctional 5,10-methylenetetrahydrofolate dehydrogenase/5,10-methenyltetrahydrofolate cyclohydrolase [Candidatus Omnitrophota bacterium]
MAKLLEAGPIVEDLKKSLIEERKSIKNLGIASLCVGSNSGRDAYIISQKRWAELLDVNYHLIEFKRSISLHRFVRTIEEINRDKKINGIIIHRPLPREWNELAIVKSISREKDIEGITPENLGEIFYRENYFLPPTVLSVMELIKRTKVNIYGKDVLIVGFSPIVGKPLSILLADKLATVTIAQIGTFKENRLPFYVKEADILISAVGKPCLIKGEWIKNGAIVIDVGISIKDNKLQGDVEFKEAFKRASFITPTPGGVGPLTVFFLFYNLIKAAKLQ